MHQRVHLQLAAQLQVQEAQRQQMEQLALLVTAQQRAGAELQTEVPSQQLAGPAALSDLPPPQRAAVGRRLASLFAGWHAPVAGVVAFATHGLFSSPDAFERIERSSLEEVGVVNTLPLPSGGQKSFRFSSKGQQLSIGTLLADAIYRIHKKEAISEMFVGTVPGEKNTCCSWS